MPLLSEGRKETGGRKQRAFATAATLTAALLVACLVIPLLVSVRFNFIPHQELIVSGYVRPQPWGIHSDDIELPDATIQLKAIHLGFIGYQYQLNSTHRSALKGNSRPAATQPGLGAFR